MEHRHPLDTWVARVTAAVVAVALSGLLVFLNQAVLFGPGSADPDSPIGRCIAERGAAIDKMVAQGAVKLDQVSARKERAAELCRSMAGKG
jgi:hypothetical protein